MFFEGLRDGSREADNDGELLRLLLGSCEGLDEGTRDGAPDGTADGDCEGVTLGWVLASLEGLEDGAPVGSTDGDELGLELGWFDGLLDGGSTTEVVMLPLWGSGSAMGWVFHSERLKVCDMDRPTEGLMETGMVLYLVLDG